MTCSIRVYKGEELEFDIPFGIIGATNIMVSLYTDGEYAIQKEGVVEDGKIVVELESADLDLLQDGVIRYTISYEIDGEEHSITSSTLNYLKTPAGYSAITPDDIYQSGYTAGLEECSGSTGEARYAIATGSFDLPHETMIDGESFRNFIFYHIDGGLTMIDGHYISDDYVLEAGHYIFQTEIWRGAESSSFPIQAVGIGRYSPEDINLSYTIRLNTSK